MDREIENMLRSVRAQHSSGSTFSEEHSSATYQHSEHHSSSTFVDQPHVTYIESPTTVITTHRPVSPFRVVERQVTYIESPTTVITTHRSVSPDLIVTKDVHVGGIFDQGFQQIQTGFVSQSGSSFFEHSGHSEFHSTHVEKSGFSSGGMIKETHTHHSNFGHPVHQIGDDIQLTLGKDFANLLSLSNEASESSIENRKSLSYSGIESNKSRSNGFTESSNTSSSLEEPTIVANENLIRLYPQINFKKEAFPLYWNIRDRSKLLELSAQHLRVHYHGQSKQDEAAMVRAICPISKTCGVFYFEILIVSSGTCDAISIGLCDKNVTLNNHIGWTANSFGYHGDDGKVFFNGQNSNSNETYTTGDVIGCGLNFIKKSIFFTKNGKRLGYDLNVQNLVDLYPAIGMHSLGSIIEANFGMNQFKYDLLKEFESSIPSFFVGTTFKRKDGTSIRAEKALFNKVVGLYFSGSWCPPSLRFTPILRDFYNTLAHGNDFEIVFVSSDRSDSELKNYLSLAHGNWLYLPFGSPKIQELNAIYNINSIPSLVIIKPNGNIIAQNGRSELPTHLVQSYQPKQTLEMWKARLY